MKNWKWQHVVALVLEITGLIFLVLTLATDLNDDVFLPVSLACVGGANLLLLIVNTRQVRNRRK